MTDPANQRPSRRKASNQQGSSGMSGGIQLVAIGATLVFGLATLTVMSQSGGSITLSMNGLTAIVNSTP
jgi:hypothetical protein